MQVNYIGGKVFVSFEDGSTLVTNATKETVSQILLFENSQKEEIVELLFPTIKEEIQKKEAIISQNSTWENFNHPNFTLTDGRLYMKGIPLSIPQSLAEEIIKSKDDEVKFQSLCNFWAWASLIRIPESRESLFPFIKKQQIRLTTGGEMITYRRVCKKANTNVALVKFVTDNYYRLRKSKKSTSVDVWGDNYEDDSFSLGNYGSELTYPFYVGVLKDLHNTLSTLKGNEFTDAHTKKLTYRIGEEYRMDWTEADWDISQTCSKGIHSSGVNFAYDGFGDTPIACLVNPSDVVAAVENSAKLRSLAITPIAVLNEDCDWQDDEEVQQIISEHHQAKLDELQNRLNQFKPEEFKEGHTLFQEVPNVSLDSVFSSISKIVSEPLKDRLVKL